MISVLLNWIYMGITTFSLGFGIRKLIEKLLGYSLQNVDSIIMAGVISTTVYAQVFSLFGEPVTIFASGDGSGRRTCVCVLWPGDGAEAFGSLEAAGECVSGGSDSPGGLLGLSDIQGIYDVRYRFVPCTKYSMVGRIWCCSGIGQSS